uniref:Uncharacterized protein n=1 Tax=Sphingobacterium sp. (strain 21) TaxID=743722 RepID=F4CAB8_SPHS2
MQESEKIKKESVEPLNLSLNEKWFSVIALRL